MSYDGPFFDRYGTETSGHAEKQAIQKVDHAMELASKIHRATTSSMPPTWNQFAELQDTLRDLKKHLEAQI